jgi:acyl transferase domain-containing protein
MILKEARDAQLSPPSRSWQLLTISGESEAALQQTCARLARYLAECPELNLADVAYTLHIGRKPLEHRRIVVCKEVEEAKYLLTAGDRKGVTATCRDGRERRIVFMLPGNGAYYVEMARGLYDSEAIFRQAVDHGSEVFQEQYGFDLRRQIYPANRDGASPRSNEKSLDLRKMLRRMDADQFDRNAHRTDLDQPLLFVIEYALAMLWMDWGIRPQAMIGYSLGEYVAACLAGVMSLEDALKLVAERARLIQGLPPGALLAVALAPEQLRSLLGNELSLMATNGPKQCVVSGPPLAIEMLESKLEAHGVSCRRLEAARAFHSRMMQPVFDEVVKLARRVQLNPPQIPYISNLTGTWISPDEATDPEYWARHMCQPVRFSEGVEKISKSHGTILLEIGPPLLRSIVIQGMTSKDYAPIFNCLRHSCESQPDMVHALQTLGELWLLGVAPDWRRFHAQEKRHYVLLPQ